VQQVACGMVFMGLRYRQANDKASFGSGTAPLLFRATLKSYMTIHHHLAKLCLERLG